MVRTDKDGHKLMIGEDAIYLKLKHEGRMKKIFKVKDGIVEKYVAPKNIMRAIGTEGGIGFNYNALRILINELKIKKIILRIGHRGTPIHLEIKEILYNGKFLHFLNEGFELQIFYPIELLNV